jgi:hypothetical protein
MTTTYYIAKEDHWQILSLMGLGRVKTKSDLVVMSSGRQIFAFFCSPHDRRAQNSGCDYTPQSFYTARVIFDRGAASSMSRHVGCAPESGREIRILALSWVLASIMTGRGGLMMPPGA